MTKEQILNTATLLRKYKIPYRVANIIGLPGESLAQIMETLELNINAKPSFGLANIFVPFPGLALTKYAIEHGYYNPDSHKELPRDYFTVSVMDVSSRDNLILQKLMCLFPYFIRLPVLFYNFYIRKALLRFPRNILKQLYEVFYTLNMMKLYVVKVSLPQRFKLAARYFMNLYYTKNSKSYMSNI